MKNKKECIRSDPNGNGPGEAEFLSQVPGTPQNKGCRGLWSCSGESGTVSHVTATVVRVKAYEASSLPRTLWDSLGLHGWPSAAGSCYEGFEF